ncbi:MAG: response regulator transcription factor [Acidimicrobiia bacterium]|nr:response regulator transcription factor [Acidimicrobiia bacterium]
MGNGAASANGAKQHRVLLVGQERLVMDALRVALQSNHMNVVSTSGAQATEVLKSVASVRPDIVIIGDRHDRPDLIKQLSALDTKVLVICPANRVVEARCIVAGASAILNMGQPYNELLQTIDDILAGKVLVTKAYLQEMQLVMREMKQIERDKRRKYERLTTREMAILAEISAGRSATEIAESSYTSVNTVRSHIKSVLQKLEVNSQVQAVAMAHQNGWLNEPLPA